ncbi:MAG: YidC/Oxa1 family membrane protein insertase [Thermoleophilia bacterium]
MGVSLPLAGVLQPIEDVLTAILEWLHSDIGLTWAWAIVVLTLVVRLLILPLTLKQIRSMQALQVHAPELKALQQKYKHDKQRLNEEVMKFYKENKVNPAASCLPILPQIPIFISLFYVLRDFEKEVFPDYPQSDLGFLNELIPNITDKISDHWSGYLLLAIYVGSQVTSTLLMSTTVDKKQRILFVILPFVFIPFVLRFPTGLMMYWVTSNLWTTGQGVITRRLMPRTEPVAVKKTSRTPPKDAADEEADGDAGDGAKPKKPSPKPAGSTKPTQARKQPPPRSGAQPGGAPAVRRRKKRNPRTGR